EGEVLRERYAEPGAEAGGEAVRRVGGEAAADEGRAHRVDMIAGAADAEIDIGRERPDHSAHGKVEVEIHQADPGMDLRRADRAEPGIVDAVEVQLRDIGCGEVDAEPRPQLRPGAEAENRGIAAIAMQPDAVSQNRCARARVAEEAVEREGAAGI